MRPTPAQIGRVAEALLRRLVAADLLELRVPEAAAARQIADVLDRNFQEESEIEALATAEAEKIVRQGAPGVRRDELDPRRVQQLVMQRIAKQRGFAL